MMHIVIHVLSLVGPVILSPDQLHGFGISSVASYLSIMVIMG
jgi:hypothetical protein